MRVKPNYAFIKKTYDKYNNFDYDFGLDNLNPKREIISDSFFEEDRILREVSSRIKFAEDALREIPRKAEEARQKFPINDFPTYVPKKTKPKIIIPGVTSYPAPNYPSIDNLEKQVENMLKIIDSTGPFEKGSMGDIDGDNGDQTSGEQIGKLDCNGLEYNEVVGNQDVPSNATPSDDGSGNNNDATDSSSVKSKNEEDDNGNNENQSPNNLSPQALAECAKLDLWWLKIILIILKIVKILMVIVSLVFSIVIPIVKMIRDTCVCWVDPPALSAAISLNAEIILSIVMTVISILLSILFALLKFDCLTDVTQELLDAIRQVFTGITTGIELGLTIGGQAKELNKQRLQTKAYLEQLKKDKKERKAEKTKKKMDTEMLEEIKNIAVETTESLLNTAGLDMSSLVAAGKADLDANTKSFNKVMKNLGVNVSTSDMAQAAFDAAKQMISIQASDSWDFTFDTSSFTKTAKKIADNVEKFKNLMKAPIEDLKNKAKKAKKA